MNANIEFMPFKVHYTNKSCVRLNGIKALVAFPQQRVFIINQGTGDMNHYGFIKGNFRDAAIFTGLHLGFCIL